jgi:formate dehydrogenase subunit gamma
MSTEGLAVSKYASARGRGWIQRYPFVERVNHWIGAAAYVYLLLTGLAFWSPYLYWMAALVGGGPTARFWHPWVGLIFTLSVFAMYMQWSSDMHKTEADRVWWNAIGRYVRNEDEGLPPVGKFNYGQKLWFWLIFYGVILLLLSGLGLWFTESIPWNLRFLRYAAILVHVGAALLTIGGFFIHVYMSTALEEGSFRSMIEGNVSIAWAKEFHRLWYDRIFNKATIQK